MTAPPHQRRAFNPVSAEEQAEVREELQAILSHPQFSQSKRYPALLRYLVEHTLQGDTAHIKERTLGIEVFGREATYDTTSDTIVRFTASEVRRRLATYYNQHSDRAISISLPVGSYIPEFLREDADDVPKPATKRGTEAPTEATEAITPQLTAAQAAVFAPAPAERGWMARAPGSPRTLLRPGLIALGLLLCTALVAVLAVRSMRRNPTALDQFWHPLTTSEQSPLVIAGGNIFSSNPYSGTETAGREVEYPFVSMQIASAMVHVSAIMHNEGRSIDVQAANATTLNQMRDRPLVLIGGYNNPWTRELTSALPISLAPNSDAAFQENDGAKRRWKRDGSQPYSAADDYALVGRFRSTKVDNDVVLVAGLGRNGTEAASQFLTDERRLKALEQFAGRKLDDGNFEAVLQVPVIQGRTGAPTILAVRSW